MREEGLTDGGSQEGGHRTKGDGFSSNVGEEHSQDERGRATIATNNRFAPGLVGARLRERRLERGITLRQFARDIDVSASFISQLETGKAQPSVATFYSICAALDISIDELFNYDEPAEPVGDDSLNGLTDAANNKWLTVEPECRDRRRRNASVTTARRPSCDPMNARCSCSTRA